ncbi:HalOD1 output domain-containing protein [Halosimplex carlsbadense]|nr:HalOD1 output domain-containing protein [Halosimplex carlsbadense]
MSDDDIVDPDALADLLESAPATDAAPLEVRFPYRGHTVVARRSGDVSVE